MGNTCQYQRGRPVIGVGNRLGGDENFLNRIRPSEYIFFFFRALSPLVNRRSGFVAPASSTARRSAPRNSTGVTDHVETRPERTSGAPTTPGQL